MKQANVSGPVSGGAHGWAFGAAVTDLSAYGFVEEEYLLHGDAHRYSLVPGSGYSFDGRWEVASRAWEPYRTRMLVRRPSDPARFNGTVVAVWANVSNGYETFGGPARELLEGGFAVASVSAQRIGLVGYGRGVDTGLVAWDPQRYGSLAIPDHDMSYDIFTDAVRAVGRDRARTPVDPMAGLDVQRVVAYGVSQSAMRLATYHNAIHPIARAVDGYLLVVYPGYGTGISSEVPGVRIPGIPEQFAVIVNLLPANSHTVRADLDVPVLVLNSESEAAFHRSVRQPDTDTYRLWELAGVPHMSAMRSPETTAIRRRDFGDAKTRIGRPPDQPNVLSLAPVHEAAVRSLQRWVTDAVAPDSQPRIDFDDASGYIARDDDGNALGGVRIPQFAVPTATHVAETHTLPPDLSGTSVPFSADRLRERYGDQAGYLARFDEAVDASIANGSLLEREAAELRASSREAPTW